MAPGDPTRREVGAWFLPVALVVVAFFVLMAFETGYAIHDREALAEQKRTQETTVQEAMKLRQQLETLAGKTAQRPWRSFGNGLLPAIGRRASQPYPPGYGQTRNPGRPCRDRGL